MSPKTVPPNRTMSPSEAVQSRGIASQLLIGAPVLGRVPSRPDPHFDPFRLTGACIGSPRPTPLGRYRSVHCSDLRRGAAVTRVDLLRPIEEPRFGKRVAERCQK